MRIACVGGGPSGLYFAILMGLDGNHELTVLERNPPGVTYGWGVVFWDVDELDAGDPETAREISANAGDAAHTTHFTTGSGTKLALEDALELAAKLREGTELRSALEGYGRERRSALVPAQTDARFSAQWFENVPRRCGGSDAGWHPGSSLTTGTSCGPAAGPGSRPSWPYSSA
jgi:2-polyprenyl-6-methoxyphenol hydroxylase-like FAD-dependent oxidoreductase